LPFSIGPANQTTLPPAYYFCLVPVFGHESLTTVVEQEVHQSKAHVSGAIIGKAVVATLTTALNSHWARGTVATLTDYVAGKL